MHKFKYFSPRKKMEIKIQNNLIQRNIKKILLVVTTIN